jgi:hypothetical protein
MSSDRQRKNPFFTNPFFMALLVISIAFVFSAMGYLVSAYAMETAPPGTSSHRLAKWLDAQGPLILGVEFILMFVSAVVAMATDDWFSKSSGSGQSDLR